MSNKYIYVLLSNDTIYVYDFGGTEVLIFSVCGPIISMFCFEHLVGIVTSDSLPV